MESDDDVGRESNFLCACPQHTEPNTLAIEDPQMAEALAYELLGFSVH
jgi:hypothetical protein